MQKTEYTEKQINAAYRCKGVNILLKPLIHDDFMLHNGTASLLYHRFAEKAPIFDYHCHLNPEEILQDKTYSNMTEIWLSGDHYKWRLMRAAGVPEKYITGNADPYEKISEICRNDSPLCGQSDVSLDTSGTETLLSCR